MSKTKAQRIFKWSLLALALMVVGGGAFVEYTTQPEFCASCHNMVPYVESWKHSSHKHVACVDCHYEPGIAETLEGKFKALSQVAKYVTATEGTKPWAEVSDNSCMRSGCHEAQNLTGPIQFGKIKFDHAPHLLELRRGKKLRCTSCHSQIVQGEHLTVTATSCFTCHFKESGHTEAGKPVSDCNTCHGPPKDLVQLGGGKVFRHEDYVARGVDCKQCHADVVRGAGEVPKHRCSSCHAIEEHLERYGDTIFLHRQHVTDHKVDCNECHTEILHSLPKLAEHIGGSQKGECAKCHDASHGVELGGYAGVGAPGITGAPSPMYLARVTCEGCHIRIPGNGKHPDPYSLAIPGSRVACMSCHTSAVAPLMESWQKEFDGSLAQLEGFRAAASEKAGNAASAGLARADELLAWLRADGSRGVHNIEYSRQVISAADEALAGVWSAIVSDESRPEVKIGTSTPGQASCAKVCHSGIEDWPVKLAGSPQFKHRAHVLSSRLGCGDCHETAIAYEEHPAKHGRPKVAASDCGSCHHEAKLKKPDCTSCHEATQALLSGLDQERADRDTALMKDESCDSCHATPGKIDPEEIGTSCEGCHEESTKEIYWEWREEWDGALRALFGELLDARIALDARRSLLADAESIEAELGRAQSRLEYLRAAGPLHNTLLADELAAEAKKSIQTVRKKVKR